MRLRRTAALIAVNLLVLVVFAELLTLTIYYYGTGHLFYLHRKPYETIPEARERRLTGDGLHPYFGPTHKPGYTFDVPEAMRTAGTAEASPAATNNFGFVSRFDYPRARTSDAEFFVGIFGGSVGVWFCELGAPRLFENLRRHEFFRSLEIVPVCLSHEGYKQPQQLQLLSYFLSLGQPLDLVINIDGFNEVALSTLNDRQGLDISMPSVTHLDPLINLVNQATLTPEKLQSLAAIARDKERVNAVVDRIRSNRVASVNFALEQYHAFLTKRYREETVRFSTLPSAPSEHSIIHATPRVRPREGGELYDDIAAAWTRSSLLMHDMLAARHVPYFHFLQPNQYYTRRGFSDEERRIALNAASPFRESVARGYPVLEAVAASGPLRERVRFFSALHLFDEEPAPVYMDDCCHYTLRGNERLADFIAAAILGTSGPWRNVPARSQVPGGAAR